MINQQIINPPRIAEFQKFKIYKYKRGGRMVRPSKDVNFEQAHRVVFHKGSFKGNFYEADLYFGSTRTVCDLVIVNKK